MSTNGTTPEQIAGDIARQREDLAATVEQLHAKFDVKSRARHKAADLRDRATTASGQPRPDLTVAAIAVAVLVGVLAIWRHRH